MALTSYTPLEQAFADSVFDSIPDLARNEILKLNFSGLHAGEEWFVKGDYNGHPLRDVLATTEHKILRDLVNDGAVNIVTAADGTVSYLSPATYPNSTATTTLDVSKASPLSIPVPGNVLHVTTETYTNAAIYDESDGLKFVSATSDSSSIHCVLGDSAPTDLYSETTEYGSVIILAQPDFSANVKGKVQSTRPRLIPRGVFTSMDELSPGSLPFFDPSRIVWEAGVRIVDAVIESSVIIPVAMPLVAGLTRNVIFVPSKKATGKTYVLAAVTFYTKGETGERIHWAYGVHSSNRSGQSIGELAVVRSKSATPSAVVASLKVNRFYPLTFNSSVVRRLDVAPDVVIAEEVVAGATTERVYRSATIPVTGYYYTIDKLYYNEYLRTGFGLNQPLTAERAAEVMKTWAKIPAVVSITSVDWKGQTSIKDLNAYKEYGRKRAKACKDNNFMELAFNDEYLYKTVDNKLQALTRVSRIALDESLFSHFAVNPLLAPEALPVTTLTRDNSLPSTPRLKYSTESGITGTILLSEDGVNVLFDAVLPCTFTGDGVSVLEGLLQRDGDVETLPKTSDLVVSKLSVQMSAIAVPSQLSISRVLGELDANQLALFMSHQVTDYAQVVLKGPNLVAELTGLPVRMLLAKELASLAA